MKRVFGDISISRTNSNGTYRRDSEVQICSIRVRSRNRVFFEKSQQLFPTSLQARFKTKIFSVERRRNNSELNRQNSSETNSTDIEIVPKRESLRRVLELSKQEYENKNKKSTETDESDNDEVSDEETDSKGKFR